MPAPPFDFEKLVREIISQRLAGMETPSAAAGQIARKVITVGVTSTRVKQDPRITVIQVCRGVMGGMVCLAKELPEAAMELLVMMGPLAHEVHLEPGDLMTWAMEGIADIMPIAGMEVRSAIRERIEERFMGAGEVFSSLCDKAQGP